MDIIEDLGDDFVLGLRFSINVVDFWIEVFEDDMGDKVFKRVKFIKKVFKVELLVFKILKIWFKKKIFGGGDLV